MYIDEEGVHDIGQEGEIAANESEVDWACGLESVRLQEYVEDK